MLLLVGGGRQNLVRFKLVGNPTWPSSLHAHLENAPYHLGGLRVDQPVAGVLRVFHIAIGDIRPLAKLAQAVKVADASNQRKAKCKTVSAIAVALREDTKSFDKADNVFNKDTIF